MKKVYLFNGNAYADVDKAVKAVFAHGKANGWYTKPQGNVTDRYMLFSYEDKEGNQAYTEKGGFADALIEIMPLIG